MNGNCKSSFKVNDSLFDEYLLSDDSQNESQYNNEENGSTISKFDQKSIGNSSDVSSTKNSNKTELEYDLKDSDTLSLKSESSATFDISGRKTANNRFILLKKSSEMVGRDIFKAQQNCDSESDISYEMTEPKTGIDSSSLKLPTTLFIGNLGHIVTEPVIRDAFNSFGHIKRIEIYDNMTQTLPYCYIQFEDHCSARNARLNTRGTKWFGQPLAVEWVYVLNRNTPQIDSLQHFIVFVDHLSVGVDEEDLRLAYEPFGQISDTSIGRDAVNDRSKGFGFVDFVRSKEAENAINKMNGQFISCTLISYSGLPFLEKSSEESEDLGSVYFKTSETNRTIVCVGLHRLVCIQIIRILFKAFGSIEEITITEDKGCALIKYDRKLPAAQAIQMTNKTTFLGYYSIECFWAEEQEEYTEDKDDIDQQNI